ncbi:MAG: hypothetical protein ACREJ2_12240 [Planctomycetota bacterium]
MSGRIRAAVREDRARSPVEYVSFDRQLASQGDIQEDSPAQIGAALQEFLADVQ